MLICSVEGCGKEAKSRGVCNTHYMQLRRAGLAPIGTKARGTVEDRFWRHVEKNEDCWTWTGSLKSDGYGRLGAGGASGRYLCAHRVSYELHHGEIPKGMVVMHECDNPACVNPAHLSLGTYSDNTQQACDKGRMKSLFLNGESHSGSVLTEDLVRKIRSSPLKNAQLAREIGCSNNAISCVRLRKTWQHVT